MPDLISNGITGFPHDVITFTSSTGEDIAETVEKPQSNNFGPRKQLISLYADLDKGQYLDFFDSLAMIAQE